MSTSTTTTTTTTTVSTTTATTVATTATHTTTTSGVRIPLLRNLGQVPVNNFQTIVVDTPVIVKSDAPGANPLTLPAPFGQPWSPRNSTRNRSDNLMSPRSSRVTIGHLATPNSSRTGTGSLATPVVTRAEERARAVSISQQSTPENKQTQKTVIHNKTIGNPQTKDFTAEDLDTFAEEFKDIFTYPSTDYLTPIERVDVYSITSSTMSEDRGSAPVSPRTLGNDSALRSPRAMPQRFQTKQDLTSNLPKSPKTKENTLPSSEQTPQKKKNESFLLEDLKKMDDEFDAAEKTATTPVSPRNEKKDDVELNSPRRKPRRLPTTPDFSNNLPKSPRAKEKSLPFSEQAPLDKQKEPVDLKFLDDIGSMLDKTWKDYENVESDKALQESNTKKNQHNDNSSSNTAPQTTVLIASQPVLQIRKLSFRMKAPDQSPAFPPTAQNLPVTPRTARNTSATSGGASWAKVAPSVSSRNLMPLNTSASRPTVISEAVKLYVGKLDKEIQSGKADIATSIGRTDPKLAYADLPESLQPFYAKNYKDNPKGLVRIAPLLRGLYTPQFEATKHWGNAKNELKKADHLFTHSISMSETNPNVLEKEKNKLGSVVDNIVNSLFPAAKDNQKSTRKLSDNILTKDFLNKVIFPVDREIVKSCMANPSLSAKEINSIRCAVFIDAAITRMMIPLIQSMFPLNMSKSQALMQSLLTNKLKKSAADLLPEFLKESQKNMPADLQISFSRDNAHRKFNQLSISSTKSTRDLTKFQQLAGVRGTREAYKKNIEATKKTLIEFGLDNASGDLADHLKKEIQKYLPIYKKEESPAEIRSLIFWILTQYTGSEKNSENLQRTIYALSDRFQEDLSQNSKQNHLEYDQKLVDTITGATDTPRNTTDDNDIPDEFVMTITMGLDMPPEEDSEDSELDTLTTSTVTFNPTTTTTTTTTVMTGTAPVSSTYLQKKF